MGRLSKNFILIFMLIGMFLLAGCSKFNFKTFHASDEETGTEITLAPDDNQIETETETSITTTSDNAEEAVNTKTETLPTPAAIKPTANIDLPIYTVNADTGEVEPITALVPEGSEITPEFIVDTVVESMADQSIVVGIEGVTLEDDAIIVSFMKDKAPGTNSGAGYEASVLDAIALSLIDNLNDYSKVIYRINGEAYISGHIELGIDEIYLGDN
jgi:hypothetical protein